MKKSTNDIIHNHVISKDEVECICYICYMKGCSSNKGDKWIHFCCYWSWISYLFIAEYNDMTDICI